MVEATVNKFTEAEFINTLKSGDRAAFAELVDAYSNPIYRLALKITASPQDAEDVLQETFIKAFRALKTFEGRSSLSTWLYRIAVNEALMALRKRRPESQILDEDLDDDTDPGETGLVIKDWCCLPEEEFLSAESREFLDQAIQKLPDSLKSVFVLRDIQGLSIRETAEALDLSETNVKTRLLRARLRLRQELTRYFGGRLEEISKNE
jgi:RNA polymerase sigma-70 factor (ECF subfamily)